MGEGKEPGFLIPRSRVRPKDKFEYKLKGKQKSCSRAFQAKETVCAKDLRQNSCRHVGEKDGGQCTEAKGFQASSFGRGSALPPQICSLFPFAFPTTPKNVST